MGMLELDLKAVSLIGKKCLVVLYETLERGIDTSEKIKALFEAWDESFTHSHGNILLKEHIIANFSQFSSNYLEHEDYNEPRKILFVLYTFYVLVLKILAAELVSLEKISEVPGHGKCWITNGNLQNTLNTIDSGKFFEETIGITNISNEDYFSWYFQYFNEAINAVVTTIHDTIHNIVEHNLIDDKAMFVDIPATIYQALIPKKIRHDLGEYYTPPWLARLVIEEAGFTGRVDQKALDPSCGTGTFLVALIGEIRQQNQGNDNNIVLESILNNVIGFDVNPVSVLAAKVNYMLAILTLYSAKPSRLITLPVYTCDAMMDEINIKDVDFILGNPPWIKWDFLSREYKKNIGKTLLHDYVLYSYIGMKSGLGFAHDDISITFIYACMDKYLRQGGFLGFVLKQTLYKGIAGKEFRKFAIQKRDASIPVKVLVVHDLRALKPFKSSAGADVEASIAIIKKGTPTIYPVPYFTWKLKAHSHIEDTMDFEAVKAIVITEKFNAMPDPSSDDISAPWMLLNEGSSPIAIPRGMNAYLARHGVVNDLNSVFFITITGRSESLVVIQNQQTGRKKVQQVSTIIEPGLIYPVLKPRHVKRWHVKGYYYMIVPHWKHGQCNEIELRTSFPKTYEYLISFKYDLLGRSSRWFKGKNMPFYSLFGIGEYTFKPYKVVWSSIGALHSFAVAGPVTDAYFGTKVTIPDNTIGYCSFDLEAEAHYVCAILNASAVGHTLSARSTGSKWGTSIAMINEIPIPRYDPSNPIHANLCSLSIDAHARVAAGKKIFDIEQEIDVAVDKLFKS